MFKFNDILMQFPVFTQIYTLISNVKFPVISTYLSVLSMSRLFILAILVGDDYVFCDFVCPDN